MWLFPIIIYMKFLSGSLTKMESNFEQLQNTILFRNLKKEKPILRSKLTSIVRKPKICEKNYNIVSM